MALGQVNNVEKKHANENGKIKNQAQALTRSVQGKWIRDDVSSGHSLFGAERTVSGPHRNRLRTLEYREVIHRKQGPGRRTGFRCRLEVLPWRLFQEETSVFVLEMHVYTF